MPEYKVTWTIELDADNAEAAAREARDSMTRPGTIAHVFDVRRARRYFGAEAIAGLPPSEMIDLTEIDQGGAGWFPTVWLVNPHDVDDKVYVFSDELSAERFASTYDPPAPVTPTIVADRDLTSQMVSARKTAVALGLDDD